MKKLIWAVITFIAVLVLANLLYPRLSAQYSASAPEPTIGIRPLTVQSAPDFTVYDEEGNAVRLSDLVGTPVVVNFWATWCRYCVAEFPAFDACMQDYGDKVHFLFVDLTDGMTETKEKALSFLKESGYSFPAYFDTDYSASTVYQVSSIPMTLFIASDGSLFASHIGAMDEETLCTTLDALS